MVYPHLDCKVDFQRTDWWPSGISIRHECTLLWKAFLQRLMRLKNRSWSQPPSTNGRLPPEAGNKRLLYSWRIAANFNKPFPKDWLSSRSTATQMVMESSNWAVGPNRKPEDESECPSS